MNTKAKGQRAVRACLKDLSSDGWISETVEKSGMYLKNRDLFGLWDIISIKGWRTKLIQVKTNRKPVLLPFMEFQKEHPQFQCEVWVWKDRQGFSKYWLWGSNNDGD